MLGAGDAHDDGTVPRYVFLAVNVYFRIKAQRPVGDLTQATIHDLELHAIEEECTCTLTDRSTRQVRARLHSKHFSRSIALKFTRSALRSALGTCTTVPEKVATLTYRYSIAAHSRQYVRNMCIDHGAGLCAGQRTRCASSGDLDHSIGTTTILHNMYPQQPGI